MPDIKDPQVKVALFFAIGAMLGSLSLVGALLVLVCLFAARHFDK